MQRCPRLTVKQQQELQNIVSGSKSSGREVRRAQAVLLLNQDVEIEAIITLTKYSRRQVFDLRKHYLNQGIVAIEDKHKGKPKELLTKKQRVDIVEIVKNHLPKVYGYDSEYWTTGILAHLIRENYKVKYRSKTSIYIIFKQAKFSYHKPDRQYQARNEQEVEKWRKEAKVKLKQTLTEPDTIILTADEMSLSTQTTTQKVWLPQGEYPKIEVATKRESRSIYGFLNIKDGTEHAFKTKWQNMYITYDVLVELRKVYRSEKLVIFWDKAPWHKGSRAQQFIKEDGRIETFDFPRAAPEENPQEHVWKNGRSKITHNEFIDDIDQATDKFVAYLKTTKFIYSFLDFSAVS